MARNRLWRKNTELIQRFHSLENLDGLETILIREVGVFCREYNLPARNLRTVQNPYEMASFLRFLDSVADSISSYLEIGVSSGGLFFTVDSFLRARNPHFQRSLGIDVRPRILRYNYDAYHEANPTCIFRHMSSSDLLLTENYDLCFIDANHRYHRVRADFEKVRDRCSLIAFHDIVLPGAGVPQLWNELKLRYHHREIIDQRVPKRPGIGILDMRKTMD